VNFITVFGLFVNFHQQSPTAFRIIWWEKPNLSPYCTESCAKRRAIDD